MSETRKLAAILAADVVGFSRLTATDEERTVARLRGLRTDLIDPAISVHHGRVVKRTGDGILVEFRSVVDAVRCAIEVQNGMVERNAGLLPERQILFRAGVHLGDVIEEADGDLMGDGVNIAARLESICEPGAICLSEQAYWQVKSRLDLAVADLGDKDLKNIPEPVHVYSLEVGKPAQAKPLVTVAPIVAPAPTKKRVALIPLTGGIAALVVIAVVGAWYLLARPGAQIIANAPAHLSIVVLPFQNLSNDPKQDYFADGITDNLTTDLSRIRNSFVIARNTAFTYKGKAADAKEIGKELGVRYVLEGSVQRDGNRVRVNAQLIDAESGAHLWANRFEEDLVDLFKLQDDVVARLANTLGYELVKAEAAKGAHSTNPDAIDLTMEGWALMNAQIGRDKTRYDHLRKLFERALAVDPDNADALAGEARVYEQEFAYGLGDASTDYETKIIRLSDRAIALNPNAVWAYYVKSTYLFLSRQPKESLQAADAGLAIDTSFAPLYMARRGAEISLGQFEQAADDVQQAMRLSPRDPEIALWHMQLGAVQFGLENFDAVIEEENKSIRGGFREFQPYTYLAAVFALTGRQDEAKVALAEAQHLNPQLTSMKWLHSHSPNLPRYFEGIHKAGLPEDEPPKHLSIVVLPFTNLSGDPKQDYFADGITDNLTNDLSRIRNSFVIARNTAFTYKGKAVDAKEIGKDLGVRYVLEGSVQRDGNRVRVNAQLIDAESGSHLWADRFEENLADLFKLQDDVVARLANSLRVELVNAESQHARRQNADAIDLSFRGWALEWKPPKKETNLAARNYFEQALKLDPDNDYALVGSAYTYMREFGYGWGDGHTDYDAKVIVPADHALASNRNNPMAYYVKALLLALTQRPSDGLSAAETGLADNPNFAPLYFARGSAEQGLGHYKQSKAAFARAIQLSPRDAQLGIWHAQFANDEIELGHYQSAIDEAQKAIDAGYRVYVPYVLLAASYALIGKADEAKSALATARRVNPSLTSVKWVRAHSAKGAVDHVADGLRLAGLPEDDGPRLSIVVLPFQNLSGDAKQDYLADVLTDELTTYISRIPGSFVIARNTAFTYKGKPTDAKEIGKDLGVRYMLEGSVQPTDKRIRTNAQLIDTETGAHLWAEEFDYDRAELLETENEIVTRLARSLEIQVVVAAAHHVQKSSDANSDAEDLAIRCESMTLHAGFLGPEAQAGFALCEKALAVDPNNVRALTYLSEKFWLPVSIGHSADPVGDIKRGDLLVSRALEIDPDYARAHFAKSGVLMDQWRNDEAVVEAQRTIALDPSQVDAYAAMGAAYANLGLYEKAIEFYGKALRLSPHDPKLIFWYSSKCAAHLALGQYEQAIEAGHLGIAVNPNYSPTYVYLAAALALSGNESEASDLVRRHNGLNTPIRSISALKGVIPRAAGVRVLAFYDRLISGLRKAGMPEQ